MTDDLEPTASEQAHQSDRAAQQAEEQAQSGRQGVPVLFYIDAVNMYDASYHQYRGGSMVADETVVVDKPRAVPLVAHWLARFERAALGVGGLLLLATVGAFLIDGWLALGSLQEEKRLRSDRVWVTETVRYPARTDYMRYKTSQGYIYKEVHVPAREAETGHWQNAPLWHSSTGMINLALIGLLVPGCIYFCLRESRNSFRCRNQIDVGVPLSREAINALPAQETLVRGSAAPSVEQTGQLLRSAAPHTPPEQMVRPAVLVPENRPEQLIRPAGRQE